MSWSVGWQRQRGGGWSLHCVMIVTAAVCSPQSQHRRSMRMALLPASVCRCRAAATSCSIHAPGLTAQQHSWSAVTQTHTTLMAPDGLVLLPEEGAPSGGAAAGSANQTYYGCIVADNVLLSGSPVTVLDGAATAEACCRMCRNNSQCQIFQYCDRPAGCSFQYGPYAIELKHQQCEWAWPADSRAVGARVVGSRLAPPLCCRRLCGPAGACYLVRACLVWLGLACKRRCLPAPPLLLQAS